MSITDELREYANTRISPNKGMLTAIADRIDERHKHAIGYVDDRDPETMAENGWVKLPVDANGETIRLGDDMETLLVGHEGEHSRVEWISLTADGWEVDGEPPTSMRHYRVTTVEDVLREFAEKVTDSQIPGVHPTYEEAIAEYAAKLRLATKENQ